MISLTVKQVAKIDSCGLKQDRAMTQEEGCLDINDCQWQLPGTSQATRDVLYRSRVTKIVGSPRALPSEAEL